MTVTIDRTLYDYGYGKERLARWDMTHNGELLVSKKVDPEHAACRALKELGYTGMVNFRASRACATHPGKVYMRMDIEKGALKRTNENKKTGPREEAWFPYPGKG